MSWAATCRPLLATRPPGVLYSMTILLGSVLSAPSGTLSRADEGSGPMTPQQPASIQAGANSSRWHSHDGAPTGKIGAKASNRRPRQRAERARNEGEGGDRQMQFEEKLTKTLQHLSLRMLNAA